MKEWKEGRKEGRKEGTSLDVGFNGVLFLLLEPHKFPACLPRPSPLFLLCVSFPLEADVMQKAGLVMRQSLSVSKLDGKLCVPT